MKCPVCGYELDSEYILDPGSQRYYELHLQTCALEVALRTERALGLLYKELHSGVRVLTR